MVSGFLNDAGPGKAAPPRGSRGLPTCVGSLAPTLPTLGLAACPGSLLCAVSHRAGTPGIPAAPAQPALPWGGGGVADLSEGQPTGRSGVTTAPPWPCPWGPWGWCQVGGHGTGRRSGIRLGSGPPLWLWAGLLEPSRSLNGQAGLGREPGCPRGTDRDLAVIPDHPTTADGRAGLAGRAGNRRSPPLSVRT